MQKNLIFVFDLKYLSLSFQGYADLRGTAQLYQKLFPRILTNKYNSTQYLFRHTYTQRCTESFKAFAEGLFGANNNAKAEPVPENDYFLRPYDMCQSWIDHDYKGPTTEDYKFRQSQLWNETFKNISTRLGYNETLPHSDIELMYDMCRYEQAWNVNETSAWCAAFLPEQIPVFEYRQDIHYYYKCGYGYEENTHLNCRVVQDMLSQLNNKSSPNAIAYFAHSTGVQTLLAALGINKDNVSLLATNYENMTQREWMASYMDPFAANFMAVKYECDANTVDKEQVSFFLNQNLVKLNWCNDGLCSWSEVMKQYDTVYKADCDSYYCRSSSNAINASFITLLMAAIVYLFY